MTVLISWACSRLRFMLAEPAPAREVLVDTLLQSARLNVLLTWPVFALVRRLLPRPTAARLGPEVVRLVGVARPAAAELSPTRTRRSRSRTC